MRHLAALAGAALIAIAVLSGCRNEDAKAGAGSIEATASLDVPSGSSMDVTLETTLSSEIAMVGDTWTGTLRNALTVDGKQVIPAGSTVLGTVSSVAPARRGDRAMLDLDLTSITVGDHTYQVRGDTNEVIAGSPRARNLGAIAGSAATGALIGKAVSGTGKGAVVGGLVGGGIATGVVAESKGWQVVLAQGTPLTFTTHESIVVRL